LGRAEDCKAGYMCCGRSQTYPRRLGQMKSHFKDKKEVDVSCFETKTIGYRGLLQELDQLILEITVVTQVSL
jgi:hypothetical protein